MNKVSGNAGVSGRGQASEAQIADVLFDHKKNMMKVLCEPCRKHAEFMRLNSTQITEEACSDCYQKLMDGGFIE